MDERERFDAQQEAKRESAGAVGRSTRERLMEGLMRYLSTESAHLRRSSEEPEKRRSQE
jgi:hypothetical protein